MKMKNKIKLVTLKRLLALLLIANMLSPVAVNAKEAVVAPDIATQEIDVPVPYGSLSGYGQRTAAASGSFEMYVNGSWSPFAGCTIRTEGFDPYTVNEVKVYDASWNEKASAVLTGNMDIRNLTMLNVSPGKYTVSFIMTSPSNGTVIVQIY